MNETVFQILHLNFFKEHYTTIKWIHQFQFSNCYYKDDIHKTLFMPRQRRQIFLFWILNHPYHAHYSHLLHLMEYQYCLFLLHWSIYTLPSTWISDSTSCLWGKVQDTDHRLCHCANQPLTKTRNQTLQENM